MNGLEMRVVNAEAGDAEISINERIGLSADGKSGITAGRFVGELKKLGTPKNIKLRINSRGGDVFEGIGIYEALKNTQAKITTVIEGIAFSMGSVIAMAGDEIEMSSNSLLMLHDPRGGAAGTSEDLRHMANVIDKMRDQLAGIYAERTQTDIADIKAMMARETYLSAPEAKAVRFINRISPAKKIAAHLDDADLAKVPDRFRELVAELTTPEPEQKKMAENTPNPAALSAEEVAGLKALLAKPATPPTQPEAIDTAKIVADAQAVEQKRCSMIADKCKLLGVADLAGDLIGDKALSIENALAKIIDESAKRNPSAGANDGKQKVDPPDENQAYRDEYKANAELAKFMTCEEFIRERRIDDGKEKIGPKAIGV